jgi:hypothetical protein
MKLSELLATTPENLAFEQETQLRKYVADHLDSISRRIRNGGYQGVYDELGDSPAGDGHGSDNQYIPFHLFDAHADIGQVLSKLIQLKKLQGDSK